MYFLALAADYDGTIAENGRVSEPTSEALRRLKATGRRLILVTGRELQDLQQAFADLALFDRIVVENGALLYDPASRRERPLAEEPPPALVRALRERQIKPLSVGRCIVSTSTPHQTTVLEVIRNLGLEQQIVFNKGAMMVLPPGVNKGTGLQVALAELGLSRHNVVGVGDAENDLAFLRACGCSAAVGNALPVLKESVDIVLDERNGRGVAQLIERICVEDDRIVAPGRHGIRVGAHPSGQQVYADPHAGGLLICGSSGIGKSTLATALIEQMAAKGFQFCVFDPEGDYEELDHAISVGNASTRPTTEEAVRLLRNAATNVVINIQALKVKERSSFFTTLLAKVLKIRAQTGRPHWLLIDEAHHLLPAGRGDLGLPEDFSGVAFITVHPDALAVEALRTIKTVLALGPTAGEALATFCKAIGAPSPGASPRLNDDEALLYVRFGDSRAIKIDRPRQAHKRHVRKYAEGQLGSDLSFYFRGPENALNLRAHNLKTFLQIAEGVDDRTWEHHRQAGDYSSWLRRAIKNEELASETAQIEADTRLSAQESRTLIVEAIARRYTAPA